MAEPWQKRSAPGIGRWIIGRGNMAQAVARPAASNYRALRTRILRDCLYDTWQRPPDTRQAFPYWARPYERQNAEHGPIQCQGHKQAAIRFCSVDPTHEKRVRRISSGRCIRFVRPANFVRLVLVVMPIRGPKRSERACSAARTMTATKNSLVHPPYRARVVGFAVTPWNRLFCLACIPDKNLADGTDRRKRARNAGRRRVQPWRTPIRGFPRCASGGP